MLTVQRLSFCAKTPTNVHFFAQKGPQILSSISLGLQLTGYLIIKHLLVFIRDALIQPILIPWFWSRLTASTDLIPVFKGALCNFFAFR